MIYLVAFLSLLIGLMGGYFIAVKRIHKIITKNPDFIDGITWHAQQMLIMYLITDQMYLTRFVKWSKSQQAIDFADLVEEGADGKVYLLPVHDRNAVSDIINDMIKHQEKK